MPTLHGTSRHALVAILGSLLLTLMLTSGALGAGFDFNNDTKSDILWRRTSGEVAIWLLNGTALSAAGTLVTITPDWSIVGVADFSGDGKADILWVRTDGTVSIWLMDGLAVPVAVHVSGGASGFTVAGVGDVNNDGKPDIVWRNNTSGEVSVWFMDGTTVTSAATLGVSPGLDWTLVHVSDFDGDGNADLLWRHTSGQVAIWRLNGASVVGLKTFGIIPLDWTIVGVADFNNDGKADILWRQTTGLLSLWLMDGVNILSTGLINAIPTTDWAVVGVRDFNGDGKADILWRHTTGTVFIWLLDGTTLLSAASPGTAPLDWKISRVEDFHWPTITNADNTTFTIGDAGTFFVTTMGFPEPALARGGVALPSGVNFVDNGNGTGILSGTPDPGTDGPYALTFTADNGILPNAVQNPFTLTINKQAQTITFTSAAPGAATVGGPTYNVTATATSGLTVTFTIDASATSVCSLAGSTVSFIGVGTCVIDANQTGNATYNAAPQVQQSFAVGQGSQTISFTSVPPSNATVGGPGYVVTATATSGLAVTLAIDSSAAAVCSLSGSASGSTVSFTANGTCVINANQAGNANYSPAPQVQQSFAVKSNQTISFTSSPPANPTVGGPTYLVTATATSGLTVTFTIDATASTVCSIVGSTVSFGPNAGTCVINANQAGDANFNPAPQVQQSFTVKKAQTITFTSTAPTNAVFQGPTYNVTATATSGLAVTFTIDASASTVCSIAGSTVSFIGTGTCVINANQGGDAQFYPAPQVQQSFTVGPNLVGDSYSVVGNTQLVAAAHSAPTTPFTADATTVLANDTSDVAITLTTVTGAATTGGGVITLDAAGKFTYTPPVGQSTGTDTYVYTGTSNGVSRTATITFNIANIVWYVNNASSGTHDGRSNTPFLNMGSGANGLGTALSGTGPAAGAFIYVHKGSGTTTGNYTFKANQTLVGAGATLNVPTVSPLLTITGAAANTPTLDNALTLASGVGMTGLDMDGGSVSVAGTSITGFSVNIGRFRRTGSSSATAINLGGAGNTGTFDFTSVTATGVSGSSTSKGVSISNLTGHFTVAGTDTALTPDGGSVSGYGGNGMEFISVTNGASTSVSLKNMSITGNAQTQAVAGSASTCGGDLITGNNLSCRANLFLQNSKNVSLDTLTITGSGQQGINGNGVDGLTIANSTIDSNGNESFEDGIILQSSTGTVSITGTSVRDNRARQLHMANGSGTMTFNTSTSQYGHAAAGTGTAESQQSILLQLTGTSNTTIGITTSAFANNEGVGFTTNAVQINADNGGPVVNGSVSASTFSKHAAAVFVNAGGTANVTFDTLNNTSMTNTELQAVNYTILGGSAAITAKITGSISGNTITGCSPAGSTCHAIDLNTGTNHNGELHLKIDDNTITQTGGGIVLLADGAAAAGTAKVHLKITNNDLSNPGNINGRAAIELQGALTSGNPNITFCTDVGGTGVGNVISGQWNQTSSQSGIFIRQRFSAANSWELPGYAGPANNSGGQVETYLNGRNTNSATPFESTATTTTGAFANGGACTTP